MAGQLTDAVLAAAQAGDSGALRALYETTSPAVAGYLAARGAADPEASTNDVFLAVLPRLASITGGAAGFRSLLFTIAHARVVDDYRQHARTPVSVGYDPELDHRVTASAEDEALAAIGAVGVIGLLATVPGDQRQVLTLRVVADLSIEQVAEIMGRSPGAVKQLQRRALLTLRQLLAERNVTR